MTYWFAISNFHHCWRSVQTAFLHGWHCIMITLSRHGAGQPACWRCVPLAFVWRLCADSTATTPYVRVAKAGAPCLRAESSPPASCANTRVRMIVDREQSEVGERDAILPNEGKARLVCISVGPPVAADARSSCGGELVQSQCLQSAACTTRRAIRGTAISLGPSHMMRLPRSWLRCEFETATLQNIKHASPRVCPRIAEQRGRQLTSRGVQPPWNTS